MNQTIVTYILFTFMACAFIVFAINYIKKRRSSLITVTTHEIVQDDTFFPKSIDEVKTYLKQHAKEGITYVPQRDGEKYHNDTKNLKELLLNQKAAFESYSYGAPLMEKGESWPRNNTTGEKMQFMGQIIRSEPNARFMKNIYLIRLFYDPEAFATKEQNSPDSYSIRITTVNNKDKLHNTIDLNKEGPNQYSNTGRCLIWQKHRLIETVAEIYEWDLWYNINLSKLYPDLENYSTKKLQYKHSEKEKKEWAYKEELISTFKQPPNALWDNSRVYMIMGEPQYEQEGDGWEKHPVSGEKLPFFLQLGDWEAGGDTGYYIYLDPNQLEKGSVLDIQYT